VPKLRRPLRRSPVVPKHPAQPLPAFDGAVADAVLRRSLDQLIAEALVISLAMVVLGVLGHGPAKMALAKRNDLRQALRLDRPNEALRICI